MLFESSSEYLAISWHKALRLEGEHLQIRGKEEVMSLSQVLKAEPHHVEPSCMPATARRSWSAGFSWLKKN